MNSRTPALRLAISLAVSALFATSCSTGTDSAAGATLAPTVAEPPASDVLVDAELSTDTTTSLAADTTEEPAPAPAPQTTVAPASPAATVAPLDLTLRSNAIGSLEFGATTPDQLLETLSPVLGNAASIKPIDYPDDQDPSIPYYENFAEERGFAFPFGNDICFDNGLCTYFGGASADALTLVGYRQSEGSGALMTVSGVTAGSEGSHFNGLIIPAVGGCYSTGGGTADGVSLFLQSSGEPFGYYDETTDEYVSQAPPVDDVMVLRVFAGTEPFFIYDDC